LQESAKVGSFLAACSVLIGCIALHPGRESAVTVKGKLFAPDATASSTCKLGVYLAKTNAKVREVEISNEFQRTIILVPGVHDYYMLVQCPGSVPFKSKVYRLGRNYYVINPIDLGKVTLVPASGSAAATPPR